MHKDREHAVLSMCAELGFAAAGVADIQPTSRERELRAWLSAGKHGSMRYLEENMELRVNAEGMLPGARSVIMVADLYASRNQAEPEPAPGMGRVARYARGRDYHTVMKKRLHTLCDRLRDQNPGAQFRAFVDTAPVLEREHAARAGLGWIGKHTLLIHPRLGSYTLLGGVLTTLEFKGTRESVTDHCGTCTRCIDACPTQAITPYSVDASRCISYLTIERRLPIDHKYHSAMGEWLYGCDVCQEVCPHNSARPVEMGVEPRAEYAAQREGFDLLTVLGWTQEDRRRAFQGSAMKRATLAMMKRNAVIVAGNIGEENPALRAAVERIRRNAEDPDVVREAAEVVVARWKASD